MPPLHRHARGLTLQGTCSCATVGIDPSLPDMPTFSTRQGGLGWGEVRLVGLGVGGAPYLEADSTVYVERVVPCLEAALLICP